MQINIENSPDELFSLYVERAIEFYMGELIKDKRILKGITIDLEFDPELEEDGYCSIEDYNSRKKPRHFSMEVCSIVGARRMLETIAHECVHIKQYINGELDEMLSVWKGTPVDSNKLDYYSHPWEIEAHGMEVGLFTKLALKEELWNIFEGIVDPRVRHGEKPLGWKVNKCEKEIC